MKQFAAMALVVVGALTTPVVGQEFPKPGPEHDMLKKMEGTWDCVIKAGGAESKGKAVYKMQLGGLWLISDFEAEMFGSKFTGHGMDSYDPMKKKFVAIWADSMGGSPLVMEGTHDKEKKATTLTGEGPGPDGKPAKYKTVSTEKNANEMWFELFMVVDGKETSMMSIQYKRAKK